MLTPTCPDRTGRIEPSSNHHFCVCDEARRVAGDVQTHAGNVIRLVQVETQIAREDFCFSASGDLSPVR